LRLRKWIAAEAHSGRQFLRQARWNGSLYSEQAYAKGLYLPLCPRFYETFMRKLLVLFYCLTFSIFSFAEFKTATDTKAAKKVVMFSATYCPNCLNAKKFFSAQNIPFMEFDIEKSAAARSYFDKLGGRGTPFLLVNNHPIQGFNRKEFWRYYK
jgi:glutaredoxin